MNLIVGLIGLLATFANLPFYQDPVAMLMIALNFPLALLNLVLWRACRTPQLSSKERV
jgi:hypothetical protein